MEKYIEMLKIYAIIVVPILILFYILFCLFLNDLHKLEYGKSNYLTFIPFFYFHSYFLGKVTFNKTVGWMLVGLDFISSKVELFGKDVTVIKDNVIRSAVGNIFFALQIILIVYGIYKYITLKKKIKAGITGQAAMAVNGSVNQTDPFAVQTPNANIPPNQYNPQNSTNPNYEPNPLSNVADASSISKLDPNITIDSIIHHAPDTTLQASANETLTTNIPTVETEIEVLDLNPTTELNQVSVDTNNPNNM